MCTEVPHSQRGLGAECRRGPRQRAGGDRGGAPRSGRRGRDPTTGGARLVVSGNKQGPSKATFGPVTKSLLPAELEAPLQSR